MKLHNKYSYGQLFCFSGLDGETSRNDDFVAMMLDKPITLRFHFEKTVTLHIPLKENEKFNAVTGDMLDGEDFFVAFLDKNTIVGKALQKPVVLAEDENVINRDFYLAIEEKNGVYYFCFSYKHRGQVCDEMQLDTLKTARYAYFEDLPKCKDDRYEQLYYKCLSIFGRSCPFRLSPRIASITI